MTLATSTQRRPTGFAPAAGLRQDTISRAPARLSIAGAAAFAVLLAALHALEPELHPSWRFVSEYAIGTHGWVMVVAFLALAASCAAAVVALAPHVATRGGRTGIAILAVVAIALAMAGIFVMDPITATRDQLTTHGNLHGLAATIGIPGLPIAAVLISRSLACDPEWAARRAVRWGAHATWVALLVMYGTIAIALPRNGGAFGPEVPVGWPNRLLVLAYCAWLIAVALPLARGRR